MYIKVLLKRLRPGHLSHRIPNDGRVDQVLLASLSGSFRKFTVCDHTSTDRLDARHGFSPDESAAFRPHSTVEW